MNDGRNIRIDDYRYDLPEERIASVPASDRGDSRLLRYVIPSDEITHHRFAELPSLLPEGSTLLLNDTRVMPARMIFRRRSGGVVEVFLLSPIAPTSDPTVALSCCEPVTWHVLVKGIKRIREGEVLKAEGSEGSAGALNLQGEVLRKYEGGAHICFTWNREPELSFAEVIDRLGHIPLPPYITREEREEDRENYQTIYAASPGAVAAPTAGLHFTDEILEQLESRQVSVERITLHVGAGTFAPVKAERVVDHPMHAERFTVSRETVTRLALALRQERAAPVVHVGTTTLRTIESLYWIAEQTMGDVVLDPDRTAVLSQWYAAERRGEGRLLPTPSEAFASLALGMEERGMERIVGETSLMILPGYQFMTCDRLITNFHQPGSTLILLVAAFLGRERWQRLYRTALDENYRFLSFGDSSLLERR